MKKAVILLALLLVFILPCSTLAATVNIDGKVLELKQQPIEKNGTTLLPMRVFFEALGAEVNWYNDSQVIVATRGGRVVCLGLKYPVAVAYDPGLKLDMYSAIVEGKYPLSGCIKSTKLPVAPISVNGVTYIPLRYVGEALEATVNWDPKTENITVTSTPDYRAAIPKNMVEKIYKPYSKRADFKTWQAISRQEVFVGMTREQAILSWGEPSKINTTIVSSTKSEQWVYEINQPGSYIPKMNFIYFKNGKLTAIQTEN